MFYGLVACNPDDTVETVAKIMVENDVHAVVVKAADEAIGVVSQTDMVLARQGRTAEQARHLLAGEIMTKGCATCDLETPLSDAVSAMTRLRVHRLIVTERRGSRDVPVGVISMTDVVKKLLVEG
ncbi:MAG: CBS domain-containing protein [Gammaproteobacteria bacterium]